MMEAINALYRTKADVRDSVCQDCGGVPQADWLPFWVYDEFDECLCAEADSEGEDKDDNFKWNIRLA